MTARLTATESRVVFGVCFASSATFLQPATYNYIVNPMLVTFDAGQGASAPLREAPSIAGLLVIFLAAVVAQRFGERRVVSVGAILLLAGSLVVAAAPTLLVAVLGLAIQAVGAMVLLVVPLGVIASVVQDSDARATAFSYFSMVSPVVFVVLPVFAAALMQHSSWRIVAVLWAVWGAAALIAARWALERDPSARPKLELITPALAGLLCVGVVQIVSHLSSDPAFSVGSVVRALIVIGSAAGLWVTLRRREPPSLDITVLRRPGLVLMLVVVGLWSCTQLGYYMTLALEYVYGRSVLVTALLFVPVQLSAVIGARAAGWTVNRWGLTRSGVWLLMLTGLAMALSAYIAIDSPLWWPVAVACLYALASVAAGVPLTKAVMDEATPGAENSTSAYRQAAVGVGTAVGIAVFSALVFAVFAPALTAQLEAAGLDSSQSQQIAVDLRSGVSAQQESSQYAVPLTDVQAINVAQQRAFLAGNAAQAWGGAVVSVATAALFWWSRRLSASPARLNRV